MKTLIMQQAEALEAISLAIARLFQEKPNAALALSLGETTLPLLEKLSALCKSSQLSLEKAKLFAVTDFVQTDERFKAEYILKSQLVSHSDLKIENCFFPSAAQPEDYDRQIAQEGGLDFAVLGLGQNAHIGYNEPATPFDSYTHVQKLAPATRRQLAVRFGGEENVPEQALTMGIKTILSARQIIVAAFGDAKAEPAFKMLYGRNDSSVPAAFLQIHTQVSVYLDEAASKML